MSSQEGAVGRLDRPIDPAIDHVLGEIDAPISLVEYGSYACRHCRAANDRIAEVRSRFGDRLRYVFRHLPLPGNELARRAAELVESAPDNDSFWDAHVLLMTRSDTLSEVDLLAAEQQIAQAWRARAPGVAARPDSVARVEADVTSARRSGVRYTPTFFINGSRYDGPWDESSFTDAMLLSLGHRVRIAALTFASWAPATGTLLVLATILAILLANSPYRVAVDHFWHSPIGVTFGGAAYGMSLLHWINDGLLTLFFLVVGLEIKREFTVGSLASRRSAALPIAAAIGGMAVPALLYAIAIPGGPWSAGWGVPMATDTAFAVALIAMLGTRVPVELRVFLTAAAIVDDIGAILVVAFVYTAGQDWIYLGAAACVVALLSGLNRAGVYRMAPYILLGVVLWACVLAGGLHPTLAGVVLAAFIPTRPPPDYRTLAMQADAILRGEARHGDEQLRRGPSAAALRALDDIHDRLESPADRMLRFIGPRTSLVVLPIFALANAGVTLAGGVFASRGLLATAIVAGLVIGKPLGFALFSWVAVRLRIARKPDAYSWRQLVGAGALAGIGFTMSLFIAGQAFAAPDDFAVAKLAVFGASAVSAALGVFVLWRAPIEPVGVGEQPDDADVNRTQCGPM